MSEPRDAVRRLKLDVCFGCLQVFLAKVLNHMIPSLSLGSIDSRWVSRDKKQVRDTCRRSAGMQTSLPELDQTKKKNFSSSGCDVCEEKLT